MRPASGMRSRRVSNSSGGDHTTLGLSIGDLHEASHSVEKQREEEPLEDERQAELEAAEASSVEEEFSESDTEEEQENWENNLVPQPLEPPSASLNLQDVLARFNL